MMQEPNRVYHLLDLGAGACETDVWLLNYTRRRGLQLRITACDHDERVVQYARQNVGNTPHLNVCQRDVLELEDILPADFVFANHLLHHLDDAAISALVRYLLKSDIATVVISDIQRCRAVYAAFYVISAVSLHHSFARHDGLLSVRKGFHKSELQKFVLDTVSPRTAYQVRQMFPGHLVLTVDKTQTRLDES